LGCHMAQSARPPHGACRASRPTRPPLATTWTQAHNVSNPSLAILKPHTWSARLRGSLGVHTPRCPFAAPQAAAPRPTTSAMPFSHSARLSSCQNCSHVHAAPPPLRRLCW
jgi:hypothetical protein